MTRNVFRRASAGALLLALAALPCTNRAVAAADEPQPKSPAEQPRAEQPRAEQPRAEQPRAEQPRAEQPRAEVYGTIVSIRGNILVIRPSLRPKTTRVAIGAGTEIAGYRRADKSFLKPGMRVGMGGPYSKENGFEVRWIEAATEPLGMLKQKSQGIRLPENGSGWAMAIGTLKSVEPFVFTDDDGKEYAASLEKLSGVWQNVRGERGDLLIGTRINAAGTLAPDGVIAAASVSPDKSFSPAGTMFGQIVAVNGDGTLTVRPRYTSDTITVTRAPGATLLRQITLDPDTIKIGDRVTFWGEQRNRPWHRQKSSDFKAVALLVGPGRYPAAEGDDAPVYLSGTIVSLDPVRFKPSDAAAPINVIVPAQMPIARLVPLAARDLKPGAQVMLVLSRDPQNSGNTGTAAAFTTSTVIVDASPWVGYGG